MKSKTSTLCLALGLAAILALVSTGNATISASPVNFAFRAPAGASLAANLAAPLSPVSNGFTYQGSLKSGGGPANGQYDFQFTLYDAFSGGGQVGTVFSAPAQPVTNGLFTVLLDFGQTAFQGEARYLEIAVRQSGGGTYTTLTPRQSLTPAPYALSLKPEAVIRGTTGPGVAILGAVNSGSGYGIYGESTATDGIGLRGVANTGSGAVGVYGSSASGVSVWGDSTGNYTGVLGSTINGQGVSGTSTNGSGVSGNSYASDGVVGISTNGSGVYGFSWTGAYAGYFDGNVRVTGTCCSMGVGTTQIDHPQDPANKYLTQSTVISPNMLDILDGKVTTDADGNATVQLPPYFQALNTDFRYQLTVLGQFAQAIVVDDVMNNQFTIKTDKSNVKVSWQVTGVRQDPYALAHPIQPEQAKPANEIGKYLHPEVYGQPETMSISYDHRQEAEEAPAPQERKP